MNVPARIVLAPRPGPESRRADEIGRSWGSYRKTRHERSWTMTKVVAIMSMSLDGYVADADDGVAEVFDWYFSGDVEVPTASGSSGMTFRVSEQSAEHLRGLTAEVGAML